MSEYGKSCDNCSTEECPPFCVIGDWQPIPCPYCGGWLSKIKEHKGKKYRHCYACNFEFEEVNHE